MEIKRVGGKKGRCRTNLSHVTACFSHIQGEHSVGFVPSVQNNTMWVYLAVVKEVYKQMNLFLAVLELPVKFKQHPMSGTGTSKWNDDNIYLALKLLKKALPSQGSTLRVCKKFNAFNSVNQHEFIFNRCRAGGRASFWMLIHQEPIFIVLWHYKSSNIPLMEIAKLKDQTLMILQRLLYMDTEI